MRKRNLEIRLRKLIISTKIQEENLETVKKQ